jgi:uncharacterized protein YcfJ
MMAAAAMTSAVVAGPSFAQDYNDPHYEAYSYYQHQCEAEKHKRNVAGILGGAVVGGLLGNAVTHGGGRTGGTVIGAAAGAAVGSNIARSTAKNCDHGRPYWRYEQTVEYRSYAGYPGRYDDEYYGRHRCRWVQSERGWLRVCPGPNGYYYPEY